MDYEELERSFIATTPDGEKIEIEEYVTIIETDPRHRAIGRRQKIKSDKRTFWTTNGRRVNYVSKGHYEIDGYPMITVTSVDPTAP
jgi:hypothetical protein